MSDDEEDENELARRFEGMSPEEALKWHKLELWFLEKTSALAEIYADHPPYDTYDHLDGLRILSVIENNTALNKNHPDKWETVEGLIAAATGVVGVDEVGYPIVKPDRIVLRTQVLLAGNVMFHAIAQEILGSKINFTASGLPALPHSNFKLNSSHFLN